MKDKEKILLGAACFFAGAVAGFLLAPIKKGVYCGNNNGNTYLDSDDETYDDELDEEVEGNPEEEVFEVSNEDKENN